MQRSQPSSRAIHRLAFLVAFLAGSSMVSRAQDAPALKFEKGERVLLYGNSSVERMQEKGIFEAAIQLAHPDKNLEFRSLAWTGDEVGYRLRPERYVNHLKKLLKAWPADVVILRGFGWYESFAGKAGLEKFKRSFRNYLREIHRRHPDAEIIVMLPAPTPRKSAGSQLAKSPEKLALYTEAMRNIAMEEPGVTDIIGEMGYLMEPRNESPGPLKDNLDFWLAKELIGEKAARAIKSARLSEVAKAVSGKAAQVATIVRPLNAVVYFGVRGRPDEYKSEMPRYHELIKKSDAIIHALANDPSKKFADIPGPSLPPMGDTKQRGGEKEGIVLSAAEQQKTIRVADDYKLNLFASEEKFPDLKNPIQIAFGPRGRLWVVTMPSFPHTIPGEQPKDKILILEDTDGDGAADTQTVFADGLNVPDGLVFYKDGIIVSAQPKLIYMWDSNGDGKADGQQEMLRGVDVTDAHHGGMIAMDSLGHVLLCDGVFHRSQFETPFGVVRGVDATTYRFDPETGRIENEYQTLTPNPWKMTFDRWGNLFHMYGDGFVQDSQLIPWTPLGIYHPFKRAISIAYGKGSGAAVISGPNFPDDYQQGMASATLLGRSFVAISKLDPHTGFNAASGRLDVMASDNLAFRPVDMAFGFDGAMYVSDFCSPIVGHAQHPLRDPRWDHEHGRIWRVVHTGKPLVKKADWPDVAGADTRALLKLLEYPQDNVRDLARVRLREHKDLVKILDAHLNTKTKRSAEKKLELLWLYHSARQVRPKLLGKLLATSDFRIRAAATRLIRHQADRLEGAFELLVEQATDPHPRVLVEVINAISHLQKRDIKWASLLGKVDAGGYKPVETMLGDASHGTTPAKGPEVPVLNVPRESQLQYWLTAKDEFIKTGGNGKRDLKEAVVSTYLESSSNQAAVLSLSHKHVKVTVNGVQLLDANTWWSSDWNLPVVLREGLNNIEIAFAGGRRAQGVAPVYLFDPLGSPLKQVRIPGSEKELRATAMKFGKKYAPDEDVLVISAVPNQLAFTPKELRIPAGKEVTIHFQNPDVQIHNLVITKPGSAKKVGLLADGLALDPKAAERHYVPKGEDVLWSTPLVDGNAELKLPFKAPQKPGRYPILCTFPGHWRVMQAVLVVE